VQKESLMEAPPLERKLAAIVAADVAGYSRLMEANEEQTLATLSGHRRIIDEAIARHRGRIAGTAGDSVLADFASVLDAVHASIEIQHSLADANNALPPERRMQFRIGINIGDVMVKDGDIFGDGVNIAARLEALAQPGVFASRAACATTFATRLRSTSRIWGSRPSRTSPSPSEPTACGWTV